MVRITWCAMAFAAAMAPAQAQESDTSKLREELRQLQQRMQSLEEKLRETDAKASQATNRPQSESALNPGISAILNGGYFNLQPDPNTHPLNSLLPPLGQRLPRKLG